MFFTLVNTLIVEPLKIVVEDVKWFGQKVKPALKWTAIIFITAGIVTLLKHENERKIVYDFLNSPKMLNYLVLGVTTLFFCYFSGVLGNIFTRPDYRPGNNPVVRFVEQFPNLSWIFSLMLTEPIFSYFGYGMKENKVTFFLPKIIWLTVVEELVYRQSIFLILDRGFKSITISSLLTGLYYAVASRNMVAFRYFGFLGMTYGYSSRKHTSTELLGYRALLFLVLGSL